MHVTLDLQLKSDEVLYMVCNGDIDSGEAQHILLPLMDRNWTELVNVKCLRLVNCMLEVLF